MNTTTQPTVDELNAIQGEWMALDAFAPEPEKQRVFGLMKRYPGRYVSGHDGFGVCIMEGCPISTPKPIDQALADCRQYGGRTDVAWNGTLGQWYRL